MAEFSAHVRLRARILPHHAQLRHRPRTQPGGVAQCRRAGQQGNRHALRLQGLRARVELADKGKERTLTLLRRQRLPDRPGARRAAGQAQQARRRRALPRPAAPSSRRSAATRSSRRCRSRPASTASRPRRSRRLVKQSKLKVQAAIQGDAVRVTGAKRDDLQARDRAAASAKSPTCRWPSTTSATDDRHALRRLRPLLLCAACGAGRGAERHAGRQHGPARRCWSSTASRRRWPSAQSAAGVTLLPLADGQAAGGARRRHGQLAPGRRAGAAGRHAGGQHAAQEIVLPAGLGGHFTTGGSINGRTVQFMVDTGATVVALSQAEAERIGLDWRNAPRALTQTANGAVPVHRVRLRSVRVGDVEVANVDAVVMPGADAVRAARQQLPRPLPDAPRQRRAAARTRAASPAPARLVPAGTRTIRTIVLESAAATGPAWETQHDGPELHLGRTRLSRARSATGWPTTCPRTSATRCTTRCA